jgi:hypothetical protein
VFAPNCPVKIEYYDLGKPLTPSHRVPALRPTFLRAGALRPAGKRREQSAARRWTIIGVRRCAG